MCKIYDWLYNNVILNISRNNFNILGICYYGLLIYVLLFFLWMCVFLVLLNNENYMLKVFLKWEFLLFR